MTPVTVVGAAAISAYGPSWRGLGEALLSGAALPGVPAETSLTNPKARNARKMMSRGAYLAAAALADLMRDVAWTAEQRELAGYYLGVGASGGSLDDVTALLAASLTDGTFSLREFGDAGLAACNPLLAFQLMNNFTLAHGAIFEGLGGPNGALFSRGAGTTAALVEAVHALRSGDCPLAVAGGADSATHAVTRSELAREGFVAQGLVPAEGAAVLALAATDPDTTGVVGAAAASPMVRTSDRVLAGGHVVVEGAAIASGYGRPLVAAVEDAVDRALASSEGAVDLVVVAPWGPPPAEVVPTWARSRFSSAAIVDTSALGATLAAGPALAWVAALDLLATRPGQRALVIDAGVDGDVGAIVLHAPKSAGDQTSGGRS